MDSIDAFVLPEQTIRQGLHWIDLAGILSFSIAGALLAVRKRFDIFGVLVLGCVTAVGGGAIRDVTMGQIPPLFLRDETYLWTALGGSLLAFALGERMARFERTIRFFDTLGLGLFASSGAMAAIQFGLGPLGIMFTGTISGVGGSVIRDLIANEVPEIMYRNDQIYATAAALGSIVVMLCYKNTAMNAFTAQMIGASFIIVVRWLSVRRRIHLPVRRLPQK